MLRISSESEYELNHQFQNRYDFRINSRTGIDAGPISGIFLMVHFQHRYEFKTNSLTGIRLGSAPSTVIDVDRFGIVSRPL